MAATPRTRRPKASTYGPNGTATRATLDALGVDSATDALGAIAVTLADHLDAGEARSQLANCCRELRATLDALAGRYSLAEDELDRFLAGLQD